MEKVKEEKICCFCKDKINGYGNNPLPFFFDNEFSKCCDTCNERIVIPMRIRTNDVIESIKKEIREELQRKVIGVVEEEIEQLVFDEADWRPSEVKKELKELKQKLNEVLKNGNK